MDLGVSGFEHESLIFGVLEFGEYGLGFKDMGLGIWIRVWIEGVGSGRCRLCSALNVVRRVVLPAHDDLISFRNITHSVALCMLH